MSEYINKAKLYEEIAKLEELAMDRFLDTPHDNPYYEVYREKLNERTALKHFIADFEVENIKPVKHSKWVTNNTSTFYKMGALDTTHIRTVYRCDNCNRKTEVKEKYCPRCGAKMDL